MADAWAGKPARIGINAIATLNHLIAAVTIDIGNTQLMEFCRPRCLVISAPGGWMMPIRRRSVRPIVVPRKHIVMVCLVIVSIQTFHNKRRMNTVQIADAEMTVHSTVSIAHIVRTWRTVITVWAIRHFLVLEFVTSYLSASLAINYWDVEGTISLGLSTIVDDTVAIHIGHIAAHSILTPCVVLLVPEACAVRGTYHYLALAITVDIPCYDHIILATTDIHIGSHIDRP